MSAVDPEPEQSAHWSAGAGFYAPSPWPADHGDGRRQRCVPGTGLPSGITSADLNLQRRPDLHYPVLMYYRDPDQLYVYGARVDWSRPAWFARLDALSLRVVERVELPFHPYLGGGLVHRSGDVFLIHGLDLWRFRGGSLRRAERLRLPAVNGLLTVYNGLTASPGGELILKGWAIDVRELAAFREGLTRGMLAGAAGSVLCGGLAAAAGEPALAGLPVLAALGLGAGMAATGTRLAPFFRPTRHGYLMGVDAASLRVRWTLATPERLGFARLTVVEAAPGTHPGGSAADPPHHDGGILAVPGETQLHQWRCTTGGLASVPEPHGPYRHPGDGSGAASAATSARGRLYWSQNVTPLGIRAPMKLFSQPLRGPGERRVVTLEGTAQGFNYWSVAASEEEGVVVVGDSFNGVVEARALEDLAPRWRAEVRSLHALSLGPVGGHVYALHQTRRLERTHYHNVVGLTPTQERTETQFTALDLRTGARVITLPLGALAPSVSMIVPGPHQNVLIGTREGLIQVRVRG